jgi:hypothetical protein
MEACRVGPTLWIEAVAATGGQAGILKAIEVTAQAMKAIGSAFDQVPAVWWAKASISPDEVEEVLSNRVRALPNLLDIEKWGTFERTGGWPTSRRLLRLCLPQTSMGAQVRTAYLGKKDGANTPTNAFVCCPDITRPRILFGETEKHRNPIVIGPGTLREPG